MAKKRGGGMPGKGQASKGLFTGVWLIVIAGSLLAFAKSNGINSFEDVYDYSKSWSDHLREDCNMQEAKWECGANSPGGSGGSDPIVGGQSDLTKDEISSLERKLKAIPEKSASTVSYSREDWQHWSTLGNQKCDARQQTLLNQGKNVKTEPSDPCDVISGEWIDPYGKEKITNPSYVDIDHVIPLSWAAQNGGQAWPSDKKEAFANDLSQLIASSRAENRGKGDKGPSEYMPPETSYHCEYAEIWVLTATKYGLSMPAADKAVLSKALATC